MRPIHRASLFFLCISACVLFSPWSPLPASANLGVLWNLEGETLILGELDEFLGIDALRKTPDPDPRFTTLSLVDWQTGNLSYEIHNYPDWFTPELTHEIYLSNYEGDGRTELLILQWDRKSYQNDAMGLVYLNHERFEEIWFVDWVPDAIQFAELLSPDPRPKGPISYEALLCQIGPSVAATNLKILDIRDGLELFDFASQADVNPTAVIQEVEVLNVIPANPYEVLIHYEQEESHGEQRESRAMLVGFVPDGTAAPEFLRSSVFLAPSRPNPSDHSTTIQFRVPEAGDVSLRIYSASGRLVSKLIEGPMLAGRHEIIWNGRDDLDRPVGSGVYFYELKANQQRKSQKMIRLR